MWLHVLLMLAEAGDSVCKFKAHQIYIGSSTTGIHTQHSSSIRILLPSPCRPL